MPQAVEITEGEFAGWKTWPSDRFETGAGPFYFRLDENGEAVTRLKVEGRHLNASGAVHGGCLLTFADFSCFAIADKDIDGRAVTVNLSGDFLNAAAEGDVLEARGEVTKAGGRVVYIRGLISAQDRPILSFTSVVMRVKS